MIKPFIEIDAENVTLPAFETKPIGGYEIPVNKETGEQFPNCCPFHKRVFEGAEKWFEKFPNCCEPHTKFIGKWWFKKSNYNGIAEKIVKQVSFTEHHISEQIKKPDWHKDITDYIEYNISSFGHPAVGMNLYLGNVKYYIQNTKSELSKEQRQRLSEFIEGCYQPNETEKTDFNILYSTYQKWFKEFPFELNGYFGNLKHHFEKQLPILNGKPETNIYSGMAKAKMHTKSSLIEALINLTKELLSKINVREMVEQGIISDLNKHRFEIESESLRIATNQITKDYSKGELKYIKALKKWLQLHKDYFKEITPLLKALPPQQAKTKKLTAPVLGLFCGLINKIGIDKREETESAPIYCERICVKYKLPYTDRVRQNYNVNENKKPIQELTEKVLPLIDIETKSLIQKYLDSKHPPKQNLYA